MRTVQARTQSNQTSYRSGDEQFAPDTGILYPYKPAAADMPRRSGHHQGSGEVLERDRGSKSPVSFQPPPRGADKIYTYDVVFSIGEANTKPISHTQFPYLPREEKIKSTHTMRYSPLVKPIQPTKAKRSLPYKIAKSQENLQIPADVGGKIWYTYRRIEKEKTRKGAQQNHGLYDIAKDLARLRAVPPLL